MPLWYMQGKIALTKLLVVILCCVFVFTTIVHAQEPQEEPKKALSVIFATMTCSLSSSPNNLDLATLQWSFKTSAGTIAETSYMSLVARPYLDAQRKCPSTLQEKTEFVSFVAAAGGPVTGDTTQILVPSIQIKSSAASFRIRDMYSKRFCLYLQQDLNPEDEWLIIPSQSSSNYPGGYQMTRTFCESCADAGSLGCDYAQKKCICSISTSTIDPNCNTNDSLLLSRDQCVWANTDTFLSTTATCSCSNFWSGPTCSVCSLDTCVGWTGAAGSCQTCAPPISDDSGGSSSTIKTKSSSDCSTCECTSPYYRGHTCACRAAIFDIDGTFAYPAGNVTRVDVKTRSTKDSIIPELYASLINRVFLQEIRLALALDLDIPMFNIEIVHFWRTGLRIAVSPWCANQFSAAYRIDHPDATRAETAGGTSSNIISSLDLLSQADPELDVRDIDQSVLSRLQALKQSYIQRHGRSPTDTSDWAQEQALGPRWTGTTPKFPGGFEALQTSSNDPFMILMEKLKLIIDDSSTTNTRALLRSSSLASDATFKFEPQQLYFPQCGDDVRCLNLGPDHYKSASKSNSVIIIVIVIVVVVVVLAIAVGSCLYCNSKKICCFKSIAEYNERKKRKAAERGTRTGSGGSGEGSGSGGSASASGDKNGDGSNSGSSRPKSESASGGTLTGAVYHGSSASNASDTRMSGSGSASAGFPHRQSGSNSSAHPAARRTSNGGRPSGSGVEMSSTGSSRSAAARRTSRGGRSRQSKMEGSRVGGLRASRIMNNPPQAPIGEHTTTETELPLPIGWEKAIAQDGKAYYVNTETLTSQWTHPSLETEEKERSVDDLDS